MNSGTATPSVASGQYTHVLWFVPPELIGGTDEPFAKTGCWSLESWAHFEFGVGDPDAPVIDDLPKSADPADLAEWVEEELGRPVMLVPDPDYWIRRVMFGARLAGRKIRTPLYYVR